MPELSLYTGGSSEDRGGLKVETFLGRSFHHCHGFFWISLFLLLLPGITPSPHQEEGNEDAPGRNWFPVATMTVRRADPTLFCHPQCSPPLPCLPESTRPSFLPCVTYELMLTFPQCPCAMSCKISFLKQGGPPMDIRCQRDQSVIPSHCSHVPPNPCKCTPGTLCLVDHTLGRV